LNLIKIIIEHNIIWFSELLNCNKKSLIDNSMSDFSNL
jgi:hypothetical protein